MISPGSSTAKNIAKGNGKAEVEVVAVPRSRHSLIAGWPCTDVSPMNMHVASAANRSCVAGSSLKTGSVFRGVLDYVKSNGQDLDFLVSENVPGLARRRAGGVDNLTSAVQMLSIECDMFTKVWVLNSKKLFGVPQQRTRLWFPSFPRHLLRTIDMSEAQAVATLSSIMTNIVGCQQADIDTYLLPDSDLCQQSAAASTLAEVAELDAVVIEPKTKWPRQHLKVFEKRGANWWETVYPTEMDFLMWPHLKSIRAREFDSIDFAGVKSFPSHPRKSLK